MANRFNDAFSPFIKFVICKDFRRRKRRPIQMETGEFIIITLHLCKVSYNKITFRLYPKNFFASDAAILILALNLYVFMASKIKNGLLNLGNRIRQLGRSRPAT